MAKTTLKTVPSKTATTAKPTPAPKAAVAPKKVAKPAPKVVEPEPEEETEEEEASEPKTGKFFGIGTLVKYGIPAGLRRNAFQDALLALNEQKGWHKTDEELAAMMDAEHPEAGVRIAERVGLVGTIRRFYNEGKHGKQQQDAPEVQSHKYDENGKVVEPTRAKKDAA